MEIAVVAAAKIGTSSTTAMVVTWKKSAAEDTVAQT
jgi:hypothetical protein